MPIANKSSVCGSFSVDHLVKYLAMRLTLDLGTELPEDGLLNFCIYISPSPPQLLVLNGNHTLQQVNEKIWRVSLWFYFADLFVRSIQNDSFCRQTSQWKCSTRGKSLNSQITKASETSGRPLIMLHIHVSRLWINFFRFFLSLFLKFIFVPTLWFILSYEIIDLCSYIFHYLYTTNWGIKRCKELKCATVRPFC